MNSKESFSKRFRPFASIQLSSPSVSKLQFRCVQSAKELKAAARLIYREYLQRGYINPNDSKLRLTLHHCLSSTQTFIALSPQKRIIGTLSLIEDSSLGLPMDDTYKAELDQLRHRKHRLAEASMLAFERTASIGNGFPHIRPIRLFMMIHLFKVMFDYLRSSTTVDELVACFNPKHRILYDFLLLQPLGVLKSYASANGNPALARHLNIERTRHVMKQTNHPAFKAFYGTRPSLKAFRKRLYLKPNDLKELFVNQTSLLASASPSEMCTIQSCYPTYCFEKILDQPTLKSARQQRRRLVPTYSPDEIIQEKTNILALDKGQSLSITDA